MEMNQCKIVQDLLPLYVDDLCSPETKQFIEAHLKECDECKKCSEEMTNEIIPKSTLEIMHAEIKETNEFLIDLSKKFKKQIGISLFRIFVIFFLFVISYGLLSGPELIKIPGSELKISNVTTKKVTENGFEYIDLGFFLNDKENGYSFTNIEFSYGGNGVIYLTPVRPVLSRTKQNSENLIEPNYVEWRIIPDNKKLCIGTQDDYQVIWERK